ncbi:ABC transporter permease [Sutcliffiella cohnii]|nr:ABC transporter permease [Sutcliffiella cohnii]
MWYQLFSNNELLFKFMLKRNRYRMVIWILSFLLISIATAGSFEGLYKSDVERQAIAETMKNPAMIAMVGPGYGLDNYTTGAMMAHQMLLFTAIVVAIMSILFVTSLTRSEEEDGQLELLRSLPVGRLANLLATFKLMIILNCLLAIIIGVGLTSLNISSMDAQGSFLYGASLGATGLIFSAITALMAQLSQTSRGTLTLSFMLLGFGYLIRAIGDVSNSLLSNVSPLGWILSTEVYVQNNWTPIFWTILLAVLLSLISLYLQAIRDVGSSFLRTKSGKKNASPLLLSTLGLAFTLQRTSIIAWSIAMLLLGLSYGSVFGDLENFFGSNEMLSEMLAPIEGLSLTEQFLTMLMCIISLICTVPPVMFFLKLKGEEKKNRIDHLLSKAVSRNQLLFSYVFISILSSVMLLLLSILGLFFASSLVMEEPIQIVVLLKSGMVYLPSVWLMISITIFIYGFKPQLTAVIWIYLGYSFFVVYLGGLLQLPEWMSMLSPFGHIPQFPVENIHIAPLMTLFLISLIVTFFGARAFRIRDISV